MIVEAAILAAHLSTARVAPTQPMRPPTPAAPASSQSANKDGNGSPPVYRRRRRRRGIDLFKTFR